MAESEESGARRYSAALLSSSKKIRQLKEVARRLNHQNEPVLDPEFFLASASKGWSPRVVPVCSGSDVVAILYARERVIYGLPTGVVYADGSLGGILLGDPSHHAHALRAALQTLLSSAGIRGLRLRVARDGSELPAIREFVASRPLDVRFSPLEHDDSPLWKYHAHLPLASTYDRFLAGLGSTTRHNFRYYRRRFEASGHQFVETLSMEEFRSAALALAPKTKFKTPWRQAEIEKGLDMVAASHRQLAIGLKHHNGEWLSVLGGWYRPGGAVLCFQCNNESDFGADSLSLVLRAYLIEFLIRQGLEELVIWADTGPPLSRYVSYIPTVCVSLDARTYAWRQTRRLLSGIAPYLPKRMAAAARWIL